MMRHASIVALSIFCQCSFCADAVAVDDGNEAKTRLIRSEKTEARFGDKSTWPAANAEPSRSGKHARCEDNVLGLPDGVQDFLNFGFQGALITTILGSITWQLVAGAFPIAFLSNPVTYYLLRLCLCLEATGLCNGAWVLAGFHRRFSGMQKDEVYIGTAEERQARTMKDEAQTAAP